MNPRTTQFPGTRLAAVAYAEKFSWAVLPLWEARADGACSCPPNSKTRDQSGQCNAAGKHPRTRNGLLDATTDLRQIDAWWKNAPCANIGIATGLASGLVVLDIDPRNGGDVSLERLTAENSALPDTVEALTGGGGRHILFKRPTTDQRISGRLAGGDGIDVKADGGYVVVAPSTHPSGRAYAWEVQHRPGEVKIADLPDWIACQLVGPSGPAFARATASVTDGYLGAAFSAAGWLGHSIASDRAAARCPWEDEHTSGTRYDSSTIIYAPAVGSRRGHFFCAHAHCASRSFDDVRRALPEAALDAARDRLRATDAEIQGEAPVSDTAWRQSLIHTEDGRLTKSPANAALILANDDPWRGCLTYDAFANRITWTRTPPAVPGLRSPTLGAELVDEDALYVQQQLNTQTRVLWPAAAIHDAIVAAARVHTVHPVRDYLGGLTWDGAPRLDTWLSVYLGAEDCVVNANMGRMWLISAVARVFRPGVQADHILILEGRQGLGKSTAARILAVRPDEWFSSSLPDVRTKDALQTLAGTWICEIGELDAIRGAAGTRVKDFLTQSVDVYRPAYGRCTVHRPRQCVFTGTTNESHYLHDVTGARRFWCVRVGVADTGALERDRDQLWAEARYLFDSGANWWPDAAEAEELAGIQAERFDVDEWESAVSRYVLGRESNGVSVGEVLQSALDIKPDKWSRVDQMRVASCLKRLGWEKPRGASYRNGSRLRLWFPVSDSDTQ